MWFKTPSFWGGAPQNFIKSFDASYLKPGAGVRQVIVKPAFGRDLHRIENVRASNRDWLQQWEATLPPDSFEELPSVTSFRRRAEQQMRDHQAAYFVVEVDGEAAGTVSVNGIQHGALSAGQLGYWIGKKWARKGITKLAVASVIDTMIFDLRLHRIEINVRPENVASLALCHALRLRQEGLKPRFMCIAGQWRDHVGFAADKEMLQDGGMLKRVYGQDA